MSLPLRTISTCLPILLLLHLCPRAQKRLDGEAGDGQWSSPMNWMPDGIPLAGEDVILDNDLVPGGYFVTFPAGSTPVDLHSLSVLPHAGNTIMVDIPTSNSASPAMHLSSASDALVLDTGAVLRNGSGAASGETILLLGKIRIRNGGHYIHRTVRSNAYIIDHLAADSSTVHGIFEFDVPGTAGYTVSLTGNVFGDLRFSASAAGGTKSYSGSGASDLIIRGSLAIGPGAQLTSTMTADIRLGGDLITEGTMNLHPVTAGMAGRRLILTGVMAMASGSGTISLGNNFRNVEIVAGASVILHRAFDLPSPSQAWWLLAGAYLDMDTNLIRGAGAFHSEPGATLRIGSMEGITTGDSGNLRTAIRQLDTGMTFIYARAGTQHTGDALPSSVAALGIDKPSGDLYLSRPLEARAIHFMHGSLYTSDSLLLTIGAGGITSWPDDYGRSDEGWDGSHVIGPCILHTTGSGNWPAPIGDGTGFAPLVLRRTGSGEASFRCVYHQGPSSFSIGPGEFTMTDDREFWTVTSTGGMATGDAYVDLSWRKTEWPVIDSVGAKFLAIAGADTSLSHPIWVSMGSNPSVEDLGGKGWVRSDGVIQANGLYTLGVAKPMNLLADAGILLCRRVDEGNVLQWTGTLALGTESMVEYSLDEHHFLDMSEAVRPDGTFMDKHDRGPDTWYRLIFRRADGTPVTSNTCVVHRYAGQHWKVHPQPAVDQLTLDAPGTLHQVRFRLLDITGRVWKEGHLPDGDHWTITLDRTIAGAAVMQVMHAGGAVAMTILLSAGK